MTKKTIQLIHNKKKYYVMMIPSQALMEPFLFRTQYHQTKQQTDEAIADKA